MRIRCGDVEDAYGPGERCRDCGVGTGDEHLEKCFVERCSERHRHNSGAIQQAISCTECWEEDDRTFLAMTGELGKHR